MKEIHWADLSSIFRLAYVGRVSKVLSPEELAGIGRKSSVKDARADITGVLIMDKGRILQVLDGEKESVESLYTKISADPRYWEVRQVSGGDQGGRLLSAWRLVSGSAAAAPESLMRYARQSVEPS